MDETDDDEKLVNRSKMVPAWDARLKGQVSQEKKKMAEGASEEV